MQDPRAVLKQEAEQLRSVVNDLVKKAAAKGAPTSDEQTACALDQSGPWPISWAYTWRLDVGRPDSRPLARSLAEHLRQQGWSVSASGDPNGDEISLTAQKNGARIGFNAGSTGGGLAILGYAACVNEDGSVITAPVS
jgi:hypothetical protein